MKTTPKTSDASVRVLETLKLLFKANVSIQDIVNHFEKTDPNNRIYTNEVILKYINTFKVFGFRFIKEKDKYLLLNTFNHFDFNEKELKLIYLIEKFSELIPEEKIKIEIHNFLTELEKQFSNNTRILAHNITKPPHINFQYDYNKHSERIKEYEKYCLDKQKIKITYLNRNKNTISAMVEPNEIKYQGKDVYLSVYNPVSALIQDINFNSITKVEQLPLMSNPTNIYSSVTFELKDRLAKAYKLHESERVIQTKTNGNIVVLNNKEDRELLIKRLLRYGEYCEVLSPKDTREEMHKTIKEILNNYNN